MKVIVAGSRRLNTDKELVWLVADAMWRSGFIRTLKEVVSGGARGIDLAGENFAQSYNVPIKRFPADWDKHGKAAGPIRNAEMADYADALVLIWDGRSKGSANMRSLAHKKGLMVFEYLVGFEEPQGTLEEAQR